MCGGGGGGSMWKGKERVDDESSPGESNKDDVDGEKEGSEGDGEGDD